MKDALGDRMKKYESVNSYILQRRMPTIIRIDGKAFHSFTRGLSKPFDLYFQHTMLFTTQELVKNIQGCKLGYTQSDEISLLLTDYEKLETDAWFDKKIQKMASVSASMATAYFNRLWQLNGKEGFKDRIAMFDSRVFNLHQDEVANYFVWRQKDATRNSILSYSQQYLSHREMQGKNIKELQNMLLTRFDANWDRLAPIHKRGACVLDKGEKDLNIPIFTQDREYIERYL